MIYRFPIISMNFRGWAVAKYVNCWSKTSALADLECIVVVDGNNSCNISRRHVTYEQGCHHSHKTIVRNIRNVLTFFISIHRLLSIPICIVTPLEPKVVKALGLTTTTSIVTPTEDLASSRFQFSQQFCLYDPHRLLSGIQKLSTHEIRLPPSSS